MEHQIAAERFSLFREYYEELVRFLTVKLRSRDQAMDVAQETFLRVLAQDSSVPINRPRAFLYKTALNLTIDLFRQTPINEWMQLFSIVATNATT